MTIEEWKAALLRLPDALFFDLMRSFLGSLNTPLNKHRLLREFNSFFSHHETRSRLLALIDEEDAAILTAVEVLSLPDEKKLHTLFNNRFSYIEMHNRLLNLQERALLFITEEKGSPRQLHICPLFRDELEQEGLLEPEHLFPLFALEDGGDAPPFWLSDALIAATVAFFHSRKTVFRQDGSLRKRAAEEWKELFPALAPKEAQNPGFQQAWFHCFEAVGIGSFHDSSRDINWDRIDEIAERPLKERLTLFLGNYLAARIGCAAAPLLRFISTLEGILPPGSGCSPPSWELLFSYLALEMGLSAGVQKVLPSLLMEAEILLPVSGGVQLHPFLADTPRGISESLTLQANFDLLLPQNSTLKQGLWTAKAAELLQFDRFGHFQLGRESLGTLFEEGKSADTIRKELENLCGTPVPQNIRVSLQAWESEYRSLEIYRGVVIKVSQERRYLLEHAPDFQGYVERELAPGVFLMKDVREEEWRKALTTCGITTAPPVHEIGKAGGGLWAEKGDTAPQTAPPLPFVLEKPSGPAGEPPGSRSEEVQQALRQRLESRPFSREERETINARIDRKLVLTDQQLDIAFAGKANSEAKGFDHNGKIRLMEGAIEEGNSLLEITFQEEKETSQLLVKPLRLESRNEEKTLEALTLPDESPISIRIRKIGAVKRLRESLYAPLES